MDWFYYNFIILTKEFKIPYKNLDKSLLFSRNQVFCQKKFEKFDEIQLPYILIFFAETSHTFSTNQCLQKGVSEFFIFFRSCDFWKN